jgi:L-rhamnose isomerase
LNDGSGSSRLFRAGLVFNDVDDDDDNGIDLFMNEKLLDSAGRINDFVESLVHDDDVLVETI